MRIKNESEIAGRESLLGNFRFACINSMCLIIALILCASVLGQVVNAESTDTSKIHLMELWSNEHVSNEYNLSSVDIKDSNNILLKEFSGPFSISPNRKLYAILDHKLNNYKIHPHYSVLKIYNSHRELIDSTLLGSSAFRIILSNDTQVAIVHSFFHGNNVNNRTYKLGFYHNHKYNLCAETPILGFLFSGKFSNNGYLIIINKADTATLDYTKNNLYLFNKKLKLVNKKTLKNALVDYEHSPIIDDENEIFTIQTLDKKDLTIHYSLHFNYYLKLMGKELNWILE